VIASKAEPRTQRSGVSGSMAGRLLRCAACAARSLSGGRDGKKAPPGTVALHWGSESSVDRPAKPASPKAHPGSAATAPALLPLAAAAFLATASPTAAGRAAPRAGHRPTRLRGRTSQLRFHSRLHNYYSIHTGSRPCVPETYSCVERRRGGSRRRGLRTLPPARRRPASPKSLNETDSCAVPLSQSIPEREQMTGIVETAASEPEA
jgi:hypothetical protein